MLHTGRVVNPIKKGDTVTASVDYDRRHKIVSNHTMTHVLNLSLRHTIGDKTDQRGSVVDEKRLRFDFNANKPLNYKQLVGVERGVQDIIKAKLAVYDAEIPYKEANEISCLRAMFGEKYPDVVRVVTIGHSLADIMKSPKSDEWQKYSVELCGGAHLKNTGGAGDFLIVAEEGVARGIRRLVAVTGDEVSRLRDAEAQLEAEVQDVAKLSGKELTIAVARLGPTIDQAKIGYVKKKELNEVLKELNNRDKKAKKGNKAENKKKAVEDGTNLANKASGPVLVGSVDVGMDTKALKEGIMTAQKLKPDLPIAFFSASANKVLVMCSVPKSCKGLNAGKWVKEILSVVGGRGGGKANFAQGQGTDLSKLDEAMRVAESFATKLL